MREFTDDQTDLFESMVKQYRESADAERINEKYRQKSYWERYRIPSKVVLWASYLCAIFSVSTGIYFFADIFFAFVPNWYACLFFAAVPLSFWEYFKRKSGKTVAFKFIGRGGQIAFWATFILIGTAIGSISYSYVGGEKMMADAKQAPPLVNKDSITASYNAIIEPLQAQRKGFENAQGEILWNLREQAGEVDKKITNYLEQKLKAEQQAEAENKANMAGFLVSTNVEAKHFGIAAAAADLLLIILLFAREIMDKDIRDEMKAAERIKASKREENKRLSDLAKIKASEKAFQVSDSVPGESVPSETDRNGTVELKVSSERSEAFRIDGLGTLRKCSSCGTDISHKRSNAKYCSAECRKNGFKNRTEREPMMKKTK